MSRILDYFPFLCNNLNDLYHIRYPCIQQKYTINLTQNENSIHSIYFDFGKYKSFILQIFLDNVPLFTQDDITQNYFFSVIPSIYTTYAKDTLFTKDLFENRWNVFIPELNYNGIGMYLFRHHWGHKDLSTLSSLTLEFTFSSINANDNFDFYVLYN